MSTVPFRALRGVSRPARFAVAPLALAGLLACSGPSGREVTPNELARRDREEAAEQAAIRNGVAAPAPQATPREESEAFVAAGEGSLTDEQAGKRDGLDRRRLALDRRRADQARSLAELDSRVDRVDLDQAAAMASEIVALAAAERELRTAQEDLDHFTGVERQRRLDEDALGVQASADGLLESREELAQLEMMYKDSQLGDATAEIVLNRSRRRLARAEEGHRLRLQRSQDLQSIELPRELERLQHELRAKQVALENVRRAQEKARLEREAARRDLAFERTKLERELDDIARDDKALARDLRAFEHEVALGNAP